MADTKFTASLETAQFDRGAADILAQLGLIDKKAAESGSSVDQLTKKLTTGLAAIGASFSAVSFVKQVAEVRGQFQQLEVAFNTMLGSKEKAEALMSQLVKTAATTPFDLQSVSAGAKQLLAYGESSETVNDTLVRLGNVASGIGAPLGDIAYLYGTTMTQGRLYTQDLNQFTGRGIPMIKLLAEQFGVAEGEVKKLVEAGQVGFPEVKKAIEQMTNEGGMFFNLMAEQSKTITGKISNLGDAFDSMFNDIGKGTQGVITDALDIAISLVENYKEVGRIIMELAATYGVYKTVLIAAAAAQRLNKRILQEAIVQKKLAAAQNIKLSTSEAVAAARTSLLSQAQQGLARSIKGVTAALAANPYALAATAIAALALGIYKLVTYQSDYAKSVERMSKAQQESQAQAQVEIENLAALTDKLKAAKDDADAYKQVKDQIVSQYGKYNSGLENELTNVENIDEAYKKLSKTIQKHYAFKGYQKEIDTLQTEYVEKTTNTRKDLADDIRKNQRRGGRSDESAEASTNRILQAINDYSTSGGDANDIEGLKKFFAGNNEVLALISEEAKRIEAYKQAVADNNAYHTAATQRAAADAAAETRKNIIIPALEQLQKQKEDFQRLTERAKSTFGLTDEDIKAMSGGSDPVKTAAQLETLSQVIERIKRQEKELADIRIKAQKGEKSTDDVDKTQKELDASKKAYKTMTGQEWGKKNATESKQSSAIAEARKRRQNEEKQLRDIEEAANAERQARIDAMSDGLAKSLEQLALNRDKEQQQLSREIRDWNEKEKQLIEQETGKAYAGQTITIAPELRAVFERKKTVIDESSKNDIAKLLASQYQDILAKAAEASARTKSDIEQLNKFGRTEQAVEAQRQGEEKQNELGTEYIKQTGDYETLSNELAQLSASLLNDAFANRIEDMIAEAQAKLVELEAQSQVPTADILATRGKLQLLNEELKKLRKTTSKSGGESVKAWQAFGNQLGTVGNELRGLGDTIGGTAGDALNAVADISDFATTAINSVTTIVTQSSALMQSTSTQAAESIKTVERASVILAIISAALQVMQKIAALFKKTDYMKEIREDVEKTNEKIDEMLYKLKADDSQFSGIFGDDVWSKLTNNITLATEAMDGYNAVISDMANGKYKDRSFSNLPTDKLMSYRQILGETAEGLSDFEVAQRRIMGMEIRTRHGTWFRSAEYKSLSELGLNLSEDMSQNEFMAALGEFQDSDIYGKLSADNKDFIDDAVKEWERYQDAVTAVEEQLNSWFGDIQTSLGDAIEAGFEDGIDAAENFKESAGKAIKSMLRQLLISSATSGIFNKLSEDLTSIFMTSSGELTQKDIMDAKDLLIGGFNQIAQMIPGLSEALDGMYAEIDAAGFGDADSDEAVGLSGAIQGASQESIDLLSGYCNAVRIQQAESIMIQRNALTELVEINANTASAVRTLNSLLDTVKDANNSDNLRASGL